MIKFFTEFFRVLSIWTPRIVLSIRRKKAIDALSKAEKTGDTSDIDAILNRVRGKNS